MAARIAPLNENFGVELRGMDIRKPLSPEHAKELESLIVTHGLVVVRDQMVSNDELIQLGENFGKLMRTGGQYGSLRHGSPFIGDVSNLDENSEIIPQSDRRMKMVVANQYWHMDNSTRAVPSWLHILTSHIVPPSGADTEYCDMRAGYDALPYNMKEEIEGLSTVHDLVYSRSISGFHDWTEEEQKQLKPNIWPLVQVQSDSKRKSLYLCIHSESIPGLPLEEGRALIKELMDFITQPTFIYRHKWRVGDTLFWDNRCILHRATPFEDQTYPRELRTVRLRDEARLAAKGTRQSQAVV